MGIKSVVYVLMSLFLQTKILAQEQQQAQQEQAKQTTEELQKKAFPYRNWHKLINVSLSPDGKWSYFIKKYDDGRIEGLLQNTMNQAIAVFSNPADVYLDNQHFILRDPSENLTVRNLSNSQEWKETHVKKYIYHKGNKTLLILKGNDLYWVDEKNHLIKKYSDVKELENINSEDRLLIHQKEQLLLVNLKTQKEEVTLNHTQQGQLLAKGEQKIENEIHSLFLWKKGQEYILQIYNASGEKIVNKNITEKLKSYSSFKFLKTHILLATQLAYKAKTSTSNAEGDLLQVEEWNSNNKGLKPLIERYKKSQVNALLYDYTNEEIKESKAGEGITRRYIVFNNNYALEVLDLANEDFTDEHLMPKIQLRNLKTQNIEWTIEKTTDFYVLERENTIYYFDQGHWWSYHYDTQKSYNITEKAEEPFYFFSRQSKKNIYPLDKPLFSENRQKIYFTGVHNVWEYDLKRNKLLNMTQNKDPHLQYKVQKFGSSKVEMLQWYDLPTLPQQEIVLRVKTTDELKEGLMVYTQGKLKSVEPLQGSSFETIAMSETGISYTFENGNTPFQIKKYQWIPSVSKQKKATTEVLYQSNQENFQSENFPKTVVLTWNKAISEKETFENYAAVILPPHYNPQKKYPTIVHIYENKAKEYKDFVFPSWYNQQGINRSLLAESGYIVILPRIIYTQNEPGASALRAVEEAIEEVGKFYSIDKSKMGIAGESFGGFETNYIITKTNRFKTAVSGVSIGDITSSYFSYNINFLRPNIWRFTDQSFRLTGNFYELKNIFYENNPVFNADKIETPLLLWAGKEDYHVNWNQSVAMYLALAGLKKEVKLLLFPKDGHGLLRKSNQLEYTFQVMNWWNYYLKN